MKKISILILVSIIWFTARSQSLEIGQKAPDIIMKSLDGTELSLYSLKGKMVLIDFWASWCPPCRRENPVLVATYNEFKNDGFKNGEGFTIFSVSMDNRDAAWRKAIVKDNLTWTSHVSDLKGWDSGAASLYNITSIPYSYLIDGDGIVVAINPRGERLEKELRKLRKK